MAAKRPSFQFYGADWLKDPAVRAISLTARGLWIDMLCLMDQSPRRGHLQHATGKPVTAEQLARMTGCSTDDVSRLLQELEDAGVFSSTDTGIIYSRRMVRDERKRQLCQEAGRKGGNPTLKGHPKGVPKGGLKRNQTPSSSVSSSAVSTKQQTAEAAVSKKRIAAFNLQIGDLCSAERMIELSRHLAGDGTGFTDSDDERLLIVGAAEHVKHQVEAKRCSKKPITKPLGLLASIISERRWKDITGEQINAARISIKRANGATSRFAQEVRLRVRSADAGAAAES